MAKIRRITIADLQRASEDLSKMGIKTRAGRTVARNVGMRTVNEQLEYLVSRDISLYGISPTEGELEDLREGYIQELVRGSNLLPMGVNFGQQIWDIYNKALSTASDIETSRIATLKAQEAARKAREAEQLRADINEIRSDRNYRAVYNLFDLAKDSFIQDAKSREQDDGKAYAAGFASYRDWYYQYVERGFGNGRISPQAIRRLFSIEEIHRLAEIFRSAGVRNNGVVYVEDDPEFIRFASEVESKIMESAMSKISKSPHRIAAESLENLAEGFGF